VVLAGGLQGWLLCKTTLAEKWLTIVAGFAVMTPHLWVTLCGFLLLSFIVVKQRNSLKADQNIDALSP
jgi:TRAP-type uncharacterized transport system fused permease subunit